MSFVEGNRVQEVVTGRGRPAVRVVSRWPTALAVVAAAGVVLVIVRFANEADYFGASIATMAGIYLFAYGLGRPWTAWPAFLLLSALVTILQFAHTHGVLPFDAPVGMAAVLVVLWLWAVVRRRFTDRPTFAVQTAGAAGFAVVTLLCVAVQPTLGALLAGVGILAHAAWDAYHWRTGKVVHRSWAEFCFVLDLIVGAALIIATAR
jgi:hypothetical protein